MRFTEALGRILNKIIRQKPKMQPEVYKKVTEVSAVGKEKTEPIQKGKPDKKQEWGERAYRWNTEEEKMIRRYRAYAFHHKKRRIRKKYMKKLLELTTEYGPVHTKRKNVYLAPMWIGERIVRMDYSVYSAQKVFSPGYIGSRKSDHSDSRIKGGVR